MHRDALGALLDGWLDPSRFDDVAENGLQVEGRDEIERVVCGVTASQALIDQAITAGADAIVVHHGIVWGSGIRRLTGWLGRRVRTLMAGTPGPRHAPGRSRPAGLLAYLALAAPAYGTRVLHPGVGRPVVGHNTIHENLEGIAALRTQGINIFFFVFFFFHLFPVLQ